MAEQIIIMPSIIIGLVIGIYEAILLHRDVTVPTHRFGHMAHALVFAIAATFAAMNVPFVLSVIPQLQSVPLLNNVLIFRIAIGLIAILKIHGASAAIRGTIGGSSVGMAETWTHSLIIGTMIVVAPYVYPAVAPLLPVWAQR